MNELLNCLKIEDIRDGNAKELAELIGLDAFLKLVTVYGGSSRLYIPQPDMLTCPVRDELIRQEYTGTNTYELAHKWNLTERYIGDIVKDKAKEIRLKPMNGQTSLF